MADFQEMAEGSTIWRPTYIEFGDEPTEHREFAHPGALKERRSIVGTPMQSPCQLKWVGCQLKVVEGMDEPFECWKARPDFSELEPVSLYHFVTEQNSEDKSLILPQYVMKAEDFADRQAAEKAWVEATEAVEQVFDVMGNTADPTTAVTGLLMIARHCNGKDSAELAAVHSDPRFTRLAALGFEATMFSGDVQLLVQFLWAVAKLNFASPGVVPAIHLAAQTMIPAVSCLDAPALSKTLWALASLASGDGECGTLLRQLPEVRQLARCVVQEAMAKVMHMSDVSLTKCLWALAKLDLRDAPALRFATACTIQLTTGLGLHQLCPQCLANSCWAVARLRLQASSTKPFVLFLMDHAWKQLADFRSLELSMMLWAAVKVMGRDGAFHVKWFAEAVAAEAQRRLWELSDQSVSNIAWALGTLGLAREATGPARAFMLAAAMHLSPTLSACSPQAISNILWALCMVSGERDIVRTFGSLAAAETLREERYREFSWQDRASIMTALAKLGEPSDSAVLSFAEHVILSSLREMRAMNTQSLLNIGLAATRMGVPVLVMSEFATSLEKTLPQLKLNDIDRRQLLQIQAYVKNNKQE